jgi:hypothetical protein
MDRCKTCKFFKQNGSWAKDTESGVCRRYPPHRAGPNQSIVGDPGTFWPDVHAYNWCGEYKKV